MKCIIEESETNFILQETLKPYPSIIMWWKPTQSYKAIRRWNWNTVKDGYIKLSWIESTSVASISWSNYDDSWWVYLVLSSWASLTSATAGAFSTSITVDHVYGLVALLFQALITKAKHFMALSPVASAKHSWSLNVSPSCMLISFHFAETLLATSFIRSDSSGSLSSPAYLLPEPASEESVKTPVNNEENTFKDRPAWWLKTLTVF